MMVLMGFGFLMTFLKRFGYSSVGLTMMIAVFVTEWAILCVGFGHMDEDFTIHIDYIKSELYQSACLWFGASYSILFAF